MHLNVCSIYNKISDISLLLNFHNIDIASLNETWLNNNINSDELLFYNYSVYRIDRSTKGGGVMILINNKFSCNLENTFLSDNLELLHISFDRANCKPP